MKIVFQFLLTCILVPLGLTAQENKPLVLKKDKIVLTFMLNEAGAPHYSVSYANKTVIKNSALGFSVLNDQGYDKGFEIYRTETKAINETWQPVWGEEKTIRNECTQLTVHLKNREFPDHLLNLVFRVYKEGVAFRYEFPSVEAHQYLIISDERTQFNLTADHKAFWIPGDYDTNEYLYTTSKLSEIDAWKVEKAATDIAVRVVPDPYGVQTPLMMKSADGLYVNIHEAALIGFPAMQLHVDRQTFSLSARLVPDAVGNKAYIQTPFNTPWRTILVSDQAADILTSKMILNLNAPPAFSNTSWIKPMKFVGVWWEMQTGKSTWNYSSNTNKLNEKGLPIANGRHGANTANVKRYIDFAAANKIDGVLVEGWNTGWEDWFGNWKEEVFDFVTPYPDFDIEEINKYAASKGVSMIMHNETAGSATSYERHLDTAFHLMNKYHYPAVKTGYVGRIIPRGEHHDGQWMVDHYVRVVAKAADHHVMVDAHEPARPTGLHRTYPNWMACEAARGNEYNAFSNGNPPEHETILPFTRLIGGPMDYTPGIFKIRGYSSTPGRQVHTTLAKQLALYVTMYSPLQMVSDYPENYEKHMDAFQFIRDVAVDWDETHIIEAEPGDYLTVARKAKGTDTWFVGAITDENQRTATIPLNFLDEKRKYIATIYADAADADWEMNPEAYTIRRQEVSKSGRLTIKLAKGGGAALSIVPVN